MTIGTLRHCHRAFAACGEFHSRQQLRWWQIASIFFAVALLTTLFSSDAQAGFFVGNNAGAQGGNDTFAKVLEEIAEYNAVNDPDLPDPTGLFKKTDDDASFVFNMANGFMFFEDAAGTMPVTTEAELTSLSEAYFKYTGTDANLLYYSVKGPANFGFSLYTFMGGLNFLDLNGDSRDISHVSFWEGIPEPSTWMLGVIAALGCCSGRRRSAR